MSRYELTLEDEAVSLHDCVITAIHVKDNMLELHFAGGVNLRPESALNPGKLSIRTGPAVMRMRSVAPGEERIILQRELRLFGRTVLSLWTEVPVAIMARRIQRQPMEIITYMHGDAMMLLDGWMMGGLGAFGLYDTRFIWRNITLDTVFCFDEIDK